MPSLVGSEMCIRDRHNNYFFGTFLPSSRRPRGTVEMQGFELVAILVGSSALQNFSRGPCEDPRSPQDLMSGCGILGKRHRRPQDRSTAFLQWIMNKTACVECQNSINLAVARDLVKFSDSSLRPSTGHPRATLGRPRCFKTLFSKRPSKLNAFLVEFFCPHRGGHGTP